MKGGRPVGSILVRVPEWSVQAASNTRQAAGSRQQVVHCGVVRCIIVSRRKQQE